MSSSCDFLLDVEEHVHTFSALCTVQWCGGNKSPFNCNRGQLVAYSPLKYMTKDQNIHHNNSQNSILSALIVGFP